MSDSGTFQKDFERLERDILELKTAATRASIIKAYTKTFTPPQYEPYHPDPMAPFLDTELFKQSIFTLNYGAGIPSIFTDLFTGADWIGRVPSGNFQKFYWFAQYMPEIIVTSNRKIDGVTYFS